MSATKTSSIDTKLDIDDLTFQKLVEEAFHTLPVLPSQIDLSFIADGVRPPQFRGTIAEKREEDERYEDECALMRITPGSRIIFTYDPDSKLFVTAYQENILSVKHGQISDLYSAFFSGQKIHTLKFHSGSHIGEEAFLFFKDSLLNPLIGKGYNLSVGDLTLTGSIMGSHESKGYYPNTSLFMNARGSNTEPKEFRIYSRQHHDDEDKLEKQLRAWNEKMIRPYAKK